jgi:hypothetical protein
MVSMHQIGHKPGIVITSLGIVAVMNAERFMVSRSCLARSLWRFRIPSGYSLRRLLDRQLACPDGRLRLAPMVG